MSQEYSEYLAVHVLNEQHPVSYRNLSRALKVHSNLAKQMLYDFHRKQSSKKPGSVCATYLITGTKRQTTSTNGTHSQDDGEDTLMRSSPPLPSSSFQRVDEDEREVVPTRTIMIVKEENLEQAKTQFDSITGIHIYSLQATAPRDIHVLTECNRRVAADYAKEDPLKEWKQYGTIQSPNVKRRDRRNGPPPVAAPTPAPAKKESAAVEKATPALNKQASTASNSSVKSASEPAKNTVTRTTAAKKDTSNIFRSFAKGAASAKAKKTDSQQSSTAPSPAAAVEDVDMTGFSDDDDDDAGSGGPEEPELKEPSGPTKKDRKADLEAMMDMDEVPMEDAAPTPESGQEEEVEKHDEGAIDKPAAKEEPKETVTVENGRRRGRRRVMKKKTVKDEEGYLVTREEAAWESFSEEEPAPKKLKSSAPAAPTNKTAAKKGTKPGQGNIMSFFGKK